MGSLASWFLVGFNQWEVLTGSWRAGGKTSWGFSSPVSSPFGTASLCDLFLLASPSGVLEPVHTGMQELLDTFFPALCSATLH